MAKSVSLTAFFIFQWDTWSATLKMYKYILRDGNTINNAGVKPSTMPGAHLI